jgi:hypothetical protein
MTLVCDQCGHVTPHAQGPALPVPYQPKGSTAFVTLQTTECERASCFCNSLRPA